MDVQTLAKEVLKHFETKTRDSGESFQSLKDESPDWMQDLCQDAHDGMLPDDHRYDFIVDALNALVDNEDEDEARSSIDSSIYNRDLLNWLSSSLSRAEYVNQGVSEFGMDSNVSGFDLFNALQLGQLFEKREVFESVLNSLQEKLDEIEAA